MPPIAPAASTAPVVLKGPNPRSPYLPTSGPGTKATTDVQSVTEASKKQPEPGVHYTLLLRVPFARGDFVDPPQVEWDVTKDQLLWEIISQSSKTSELDWEDLATDFGVRHDFLLQQAAWLYERHLSHVRAQMRRMAPSTISATANPGHGASLESTTGIASGGVPMKRLGSGGSRAPSAMSIRTRDSPVLRTETEAGSPVTSRPTTMLSRNPSTATVTQSKQVLLERTGLQAATPPSPKQQQRSFRSSYVGSKKSEGSVPGAIGRKLSSPSVVRPNASSPDSVPDSPTSDESSSSGEDTAAPAGVRRSQIFRRQPRFRAQNTALDTVADASGKEDDEDDEDAEYLPFAAATAIKPSTSKKPAALLRATGTKRRQAQEASSTTTTMHDKQGQPILKSTGNARQIVQAGHISRNNPPTGISIKGKEREFEADVTSPEELTSPAASASSASSVPHSDNPASLNKQHHAGNVKRAGSHFSPHRADLARLSPGRNRSGELVQGSEGTPSMGSSFSDLDVDASISQSALEEALMSRMNRGGVASKMSTISQALRSKYL